MEQVSSMGFMSGSAAPCVLARSSSFLLPTLAKSSAMVTSAKILASQIFGRMNLGSKQTYPLFEKFLPVGTKSNVNSKNAHILCILAAPPRLDFSDKGTSNPCKPGNKTSYHLQRWLIQRKAQMYEGSQSTLMNTIICKNHIHLESWKLNLCE